ncbi:hypothetical protein PHET_08362 [Paragonimus heterotremus]|uniref:Uncharacterized protein n=1 Tax=Paragonimus heterotremus TaxID=100268 RepID=A0A8J4SM27_9TREM|nr:hypothetical protein PHET_08362 [Paragonimus heterotremus]
MYPRLSDSGNSISKEEEQVLTNCRLQLECTSPTIPKQIHSPPNSPKYPKESRVRVPILSSRGPQGVRGMPGPPGPRGVRGPPGQCTENTNFSFSHSQMHHLLRQMNKLRMHVAFFVGLEYNIVDKPTDLNPKASLLPQWMAFTYFLWLSLRKENLRQLFDSCTMNTQSWIFGLRVHRGPQPATKPFYT